MLTTKQLEIYMKEREIGKTQILAAAKSGISERSGRKIDHQTHSHFKEPKKRGSTRKDPLSGAWEKDLVPYLEKEPRVQVKTLLAILQKKCPGKYTTSHMRTLFRRRQEWMAMNGPAKEVIFRQDHFPGEQGMSDFTVANKLKVTIQGKKFDHRLYHFRLTFSGWEYAKVILGGESYPALAEGLQTALQLLEGSPKTHRSDSLSAAYKNLSRSEKDDFTNRYQNLCEYYHMKPTRNNLGVSHENGSIESANRHLKDRIEQALILRGSKDFESINDYQTLINEVMEETNKSKQRLINEEIKILTPLPKNKTQDFDEISIKVTSQSTINIKHIIYSVPSRLVGMRVTIQLYDDRLKIYLRGSHITTIKRLRAAKGQPNHQIDYRHFAESLARKPGAFRNARFKDHFFPSPIYKQAWAQLDQQLEYRKAPQEYTAILKLAATAQEKVTHQLETLIKTKVSVAFSAGGIFSQNQSDLSPSAAVVVRVVCLFDNR